MSQIHATMPHGQNQRLNQRGLERGRGGGRGTRGERRDVTDSWPEDPRGTGTRRTHNHIDVALRPGGSTTEPGPAPGAGLRHTTDPSVPSGGATLSCLCCIQIV